MKGEKREGGNNERDKRMEEGKGNKRENRGKKRQAENEFIKYFVLTL